MEELPKNVTTTLGRLRKNRLLKLAYTTRRLLKSTALWFFFFLFLGALVSGIGSYIFLRSNQLDMTQKISLKEISHMEIYRPIILQALRDIASDIQIIQERNRDLDYHLEADRLVAELDAVSYLKIKRYYDQIRYLNEDGMEMMRVNSHGGAPSATPTPLLQDKKNRYYFVETARLSPKGIFVSSLDLNVERGKIEKPYKPTLRFGKPDYGRKGNLKGMYVINYLGKNLLQHIKNAAPSPERALHMINEQGYWLSSPRKEDEWGFMLPERAGRRFDLEHPMVWSELTRTRKGQIATEKGLFSFTTVELTDLKLELGKEVDIHSAAKWWIISHISAPEMRTQTSTLRGTMFWLWLAMVLCSAIPSWLLAVAWSRRKEHQRQLWYAANFDELTGLVNRPSFLRGLQALLNEGKRYKRGVSITFIDLDGFKAINDTHGHDAGDSILKQTAERLRNCIRDSDIVARFGGDEFCALLKETRSDEDTTIVAERILVELSKPFPLGNVQGRIGASIGLARFPLHGTSVDH